jgi:hypothetical protein
VLVPLVGAAIAVIRAISAARERAGERPVAPSPHDITIAAPASGSADRPKHCRDDGTVCRGPAARNSARRT